MPEKHDAAWRGRTRAWEYVSSPHAAPTAALAAFPALLTGEHARRIPHSPTAFTEDLMKIAEFETLVENAAETGHSAWTDAAV